MTPVGERTPPKTARLLKRLRRIDELHPISAPCSSSSMPCSIRGGAPRPIHAHTAQHEAQGELTISPA